MSQSGPETVLVYRDRIVPRSEAHFLRRLYLGFERLRPVWIGCRTDDGLADLGAQPLILGGPGIGGSIARARFKNWGSVPGTPALASLHPRLIHAHFGKGGALALPLARALGVPLVVTFHGGDATKDKPYRRSLFPTVYQRRLEALKREAACFVCVSDFIRQTLIERGFPPDKLRVIRYGIEPDEGGPPVEADAPYLLFVGRFVEKKGLRYLIEAMKLVAAAGRTPRLKLVGDGPLLGEMTGLAAPLTGVEFLGWRDNVEVKRLMRGALALIVPSVVARAGDAEGLPNVVLEAMAAGAPVIGSQSAGIAEAVIDGETGLIVPPGDTRALAGAIEALLFDAELGPRLGNAGRRRATVEFGAVVQSRRLEALLLEVSRSQ